MMNQNAQQHYCFLPFNTVLLYRHPVGRVVPCCFSPVETGNLRAQPLETIWNSPAIQALRKSIIDGSYRFCPPSCYMISRSPVLEELEEPIQTFVREKRTALPLSAIQRFSDGHDGRCNLACPSCRDGLHGIPREELDAYDLVEKEILKLLRYVEEYDTSLQGDPFASPFTRNLLKTMDPRFYPRLKIISIETNGQLLDQQMWAAMSLIHPLIRIILISVDAAAPETYEINRCPGKWNRLIDNIEYLAGVRAQMDDPFHFHLKFVVQQNNFRELPRFIELCRQWKATAFLQYLENWGTYTENDFNRRAVHRPEHPEYMQLRRILDMPELHQPHVDWGTLTAVGLSPA